MRRLTRAVSFLSLAVAISLSGCVQDNIPSEGPSSESSSPARGVQWPALRSLDGMAHRTGSVIQNGEEASLRGFAAQMRDLSLRVASDPVPQGARNAGEVRILQADLQSLAESLKAADSVDQASLVQSLQAFGPLVHRLMASAGLPHEHGTTNDHDDHDHDDHDHGHSSAASSPMTLKDLDEIEGPGPNGGTILHATPTSLMEVVVRSKEGTIVVFALDEDEKPYDLDDPLSAELVFEGWTDAGKAINVALYPDSSQLTYQRFEGFDESLRGAEWIVGILRGKFRETGSMQAVNLKTGWPPTHPDAAHAYEPHDHSHDGHEH